MVGLPIVTIYKYILQMGHFLFSDLVKRPEGSVPRSQELATCPYSEPDESSPHLHTLVP